MLKPVRKQTGSILLTLMLVIIVAASFSLVSKLNESSRAFIRRQATLEVLHQAKAALISYAITFPESWAGKATEGPGYLPCPDTNNDGSPSPPCGPNPLGRLPGEWMGMAGYTDSSGERLWYAVSSNFRNNPSGKIVPMNSDVPGQLSIDTNNDGEGDIKDIVAVIIAPGPADTGILQTRPSNLVGDYLEGENNDGDTVYAQNSGGGNDILVYITRRELMQAIEKRVLGDVTQAIRNYQANQNAFPWLSPFTAPNTSSFRGQASTSQGQIPFHWAADPNSISNGGAVTGRNPFTTDVMFSWNISNATITDLGPNSLISDQALSNSAYNDPIFGTISPVNVTSAQCTWTDRTGVNCTGSFTKTKACPNQCGGGNGTCTRTYQFNLQYTGTPTINNPTSTSVRTRDVAITASSLPVPSPVTWSIQVSDTYTRNEGWWIFCFPVTRNDTKNLTIDADTTGTVLSQGIQYDLDLDGVDLNGDGDYTDSEITDMTDLNGDGDQLDVEVAPELPQWFAANKWQDLIYLAYAGNEPLPGSTVTLQDCSNLPGPGSCITVNGSQTITNVRAVVLDAGLTGLKTDNTTVQVRPSASLSDYFEGGNEAIVNTIIKNNWSTNFNDQIRVIATAP